MKGWVGMKIILLSLALFLLLSSAQAGLVIEFDKNTPASERQAFAESANLEAARTKANPQSSMKTIERGGLSQHQNSGIKPSAKEGNSFGDLYMQKIQRNKDEAERERVATERGDVDEAARIRQDRSNRRTAEQLRQIQQEIQNRQRGIGY